MKVMKVGAVASLVVMTVVLTACGGAKGQNSGKAVPSDQTSPSATPSAVLAVHAKDEAFTVGIWRLTITGVESDRTDTSAGEPKNVTAVKVDYTNAGTTPAEFTVADSLGPGTVGTVYATDAAGRRYDIGYVWARGTVNPGVSGSNEFVFETPKGLRLTQIIIGASGVNL
jgi:hypothetical protein